MVRLQAGATFHFHGGAVPHDLILGSEEGTIVHSTTGVALWCVRPRLADFNGWVRSEGLAEGFGMGIADVQVALAASAPNAFGVKPPL